MSKPDSPCPVLELRRILGLSQRQLARWADIPFSVINNTELGRVKLPPEDMRTLRRVSGLKWDGREWVIDPAWKEIIPLGNKKASKPTREKLERLQQHRTMFKEVGVPQALRRKVVAHLAKDLIALGKTVHPRFWGTFLQEYQMFREMLMQAVDERIAELEDTIAEHEARKELGLDQESGHRGMRPQGASPSTSAKR
jgi:transcriptional regulator with XRE-family HTH domain